MVGLHETEMAWERKPPRPDAEFKALAKKKKKKDRRNHEAKI